MFANSVESESKDCMGGALGLPEVPIGDPGGQLEAGVATGGIAKRAEEDFRLPFLVIPILAPGGGVSPLR